MYGNLYINIIKKMVGHLVLQTLSILASLITLGLCNIGTSVPVAVDVYKGTQTAQFLGDRLIAVKWVGQGPEFKWVGAGDTETYEFRVQDYGVKDDIILPYFQMPKEGIVMILLSRELLD
ncbi:uncharacterized protein MELLADRAFT_113426 [Melampsora larici-populina 98AG31]|uniref:Uncharacterized protein n=1 Tax=Melampsora larici-populina (strain 98AG31 / pathotype 3-4-7) TaxID=747676 RepID=F4S9U5_MELLP|nr:uncharacterized protein MELLADRAFT_113426 [Melampsora larici-populina 98AG31]EGF98577.1 hypothetical protein MELLADRAFT_113426 [Melampsora larici-populina 98AG31]